MPFPRPNQSSTNLPATTGTYVSYARLVSLRNEMRQVRQQATASLHESLTQSEELQTLHIQYRALPGDRAYNALQEIQGSIYQSEANVDRHIRHILRTTRTVRRIRVTLLVVRLVWSWLLRRWATAGREV